MLAVAVVVCFVWLLRVVGCCLLRCSLIVLLVVVGCFVVCDCFIVGTCWLLTVGCWLVGVDCWLLVVVLTVVGFRFLVCCSLCSGFGNCLMACECLLLVVACLL